MNELSAGGAFDVYVIITGFLLTDKLVYRDL